MVQWADGVPDPGSAPCGGAQRTDLVDAGKARALLELLLLHANEVIPTDRLVDSLWGDSPPDTAEHGVEVYVSRLRRALGGDRFETHAGGYCIRVDEGELDLQRFETLTADGTRHWSRGRSPGGTAPP